MNDKNSMFHLQCMDVAVTAGIFNQSQLSKVKKFVASKVDRRQLGVGCLDFSTLFCDAKKAQFLTIVSYHGTVKLSNKERFDKEQIGVKEPFPRTNCQ